MSSWNGPTRIIEPSFLLLAELPTCKPWGHHQGTGLVLQPEETDTTCISHIFSLDPFLISTYFIKPLVFWHNTGQFQLYLNFFNIINLASISQLKKPNQNKQTLFFSFLCGLFSKTISDMQRIVDTWILIIFTNIKIPETSVYIDELINCNQMDLHSVTSYWVTNV